MMHIDNRSLVSKLLAISDTNEAFDQHGLCIGADDGVTGWQCTKPYTKLKPKTKTDESQFSLRKRHLPPLPLQWKNISQFTSGAVKPAIVKSEKLVAIKPEKPQCAKERKKLNKKRLEKLVAMTKHCTDQDTKCLSKPSENIEDRLEPTIKPPPGIGLSPKDAEQRYLPSFMNQIPNLDRELLHDRIILNRLRTLSSCSKRYGYGLTKIALHYGLAGPELRGKVDTPKLPTVKTSSSQAVEPHGKKRRSRLSNNGKNVKIKVDHIQKRLKDLSSHVLYPNQASESKEKEK
uniref:Uncharacterized protein n=1 Tax=Ciona savignyi TaxID=51511 RepID=H2Z7S5_CIOSA